MVCKTETTNIAEVDDEGNEIDIEYSCTQYPATKGMIFKLKVIEMFGATLTKLLPAMNGEEADQIGALGSAVESLFKNKSPEKIIGLITEMICTGSVARNGKKMVGGQSAYDQFYSGDNQIAAYKVFLFVLRTNYAGFFKGKKAQDLLAKVGAKL